MPEPTDWVTRAADDTVRHHEKFGTGDLITCASGASPSGHVHLGNLREFLTVHFVAEELRRRGLTVRHLHSWDDYDRFRKVPAGVDPSWATHIGRPLSAVPDPSGEYESWAERFKAPLVASLRDLGVEMEAKSQTVEYTSGRYRAPILGALSRRTEIEAILARYRTKPVQAGSEQEAAALADSVTAEDDGPDTGALARFPYKPFCAECGRDTTTVTSYDDTTHVLSYQCSACGFVGDQNLAEDDMAVSRGKLVWKVDWPMRWAFEGVAFEPGGVDHASPGSSYTVGKDMVRIFDGAAPWFVGYSFVGAGGQVKMSSSRGGVPTATDALRILEAPILRWLYVRRQPKQAFNVDFGPEVVRLYDEWDTLGKKAADPDRRDAHVLAFERASSTQHAGVLPTPAVPVPFRLLSSVADVTAGSADLISAVVTGAGYPHDSVGDLEPRLDKAMTWMADYVPQDQRTTVRTVADADRLAGLSAREQTWITTLLDQMGTGFDLGQITSLVYGVPKLVRGLALDDAPTEEVKSDQKAFFHLLYNLLVDADAGPRLPTLFLALGPDRIRALLSTGATVGAPNPEGTP